MRADSVTAFHAGHTTTTAMKHYTNQNQMQKAISLNLFQSSVSEATAKAFL